MERVNRILHDEFYQKCLQANAECERERVFCRHDMSHLLDVARLAYLRNLEEGLGFDKEMIYAAAMLHDIGRFVQYTEGISHEIAGAELAPDILRRCGFDEEETRQIVQAIGAHRRKEIKDELTLGGVLYRADKQSRRCFACEAAAECNWPEEKKNKEILL